MTFLTIDREIKTAHLLMVILPWHPTMMFTVISFKLFQMALKMSLADILAG